MFVNLKKFVPTHGECFMYRFQSAICRKIMLIGINSSKYIVTVQVFILFLGLRHLGDVLPFLPQFYTSDYGREILSDIKTAVNEPEAPAPVPDAVPKQNIELKIPSIVTGRYVYTQGMYYNNTRHFTHYTSLFVYLI